MVIHRAGKLHINADAMSRICNLEFINQEHEDVSSKTLDIWEDKLLTDYITTGKMAPGLQHKQVKRIKGNNQRFSFLRLCYL